MTPNDSFDRMKQDGEDVFTAARPAADPAHLFDPLCWNGIEIVAAAHAEGLTVVGSDRHFSVNDVPLIDARR